MNILITNDDGYRASGIKILAKRLAKEHNVVVVAPMNEKSGASHSVSFFTGISYENLGLVDGIKTYAVDGTPADCVMFAVNHLFRDTKFDVVVSGINTTMNAGSDIIFSGTFGAAREATFLRIAGIAVSVHARGTDEYEFTADFIANNLDMLKGFARQDVTLNVNVPCTRREDIKGIKIAPVAFQPYEESYVLKKDACGKEIYCVDGHPIKHTEEMSDGDCYLLDQGYITISPVQMICTHEETLNDMREAEFVL